MAQPQELQDDLLGFQNNEANKGGDGGNEKSLRKYQVEVTPEEYELIEQLEAMGLDRSDVVKVLMACNKKEDLAANYLLDHILDFQE